MDTTTIIHLDEVEFTILKIIVSINLLIAIHADIGILHITIANATTSAVARITIDTSFQTLGVDIVAHHLQTIGEALWMNTHLTFGRTTILESIINIDVFITYILQSLTDHRVSLSFNNVFGNVYRESVP